MLSLLFCIASSLSLACQGLRTGGDFKPFSKEQAKAYRKTLALKIKEAFEDKADENKTDEQKAKKEGN